MLIAGVAWVRAHALQPEGEAARQRGHELGARAYGAQFEEQALPPAIGRLETNAVERRR